MIKAATYSRYSSDSQRETSIDDQERNQSLRAITEGWTVLARFSDREISAATPMAMRPGGKAMLEAAERRAFDVLIIEGLDRCWRDIVDQERTLRRMEFLGIRVVGVSDAYDTRHDDRELQRGVRGLLNQQYLRDLAKKTHRGLTGQIHRGGHAGGLSYGYRSVEAGPVHRLEIDQEQAGWVRWIYEHYAQGWSCQRIAHELNRLGIKTARGTTWGVSAIYGCPKKSTGVLNNELYVGRYVWNRSQWIKDSETGKRTRRDRPADEWLVEDKPELRIVSDDLWQAARDRIGVRYLEGGSAGRGGRQKTLLGGVLRCAHCGGRIIAVSRDHYGCQIRKDRGPTVCPGVTIRRDHLERRLLTEVREEVLSFEAIAYMISRVGKLQEEVDEELRLNATSAERRTTDLDAEISRLVEAIAAIGHSPALRDRLTAAETERARLQDAIKAPQRFGDSADIVPIYKRKVLLLASALESEKDVARPILKAIFEGSYVSSDAYGPYVDVQMNTASMLAKTAVGHDILGLVAGARFLTQKRIRF